MKIKKILTPFRIGICLLPFQAMASTGAVCPPDAAEINLQAREFAIKNKLFSTETEVKIGNMMSSEWTITKLQPFQGRCLVVLNMVLKDIKTGVILDQNEHSNVAVEVVNMHNAGNPDFQLFEEAFKVPPKIRVAIGNAPNGSQHLETFYYNELSGDSVIDAFKAVTSQTKSCGYNAYIARVGKLAFDPTPNRDWQALDATFSTSRGNSVEVADIRPEYFDTNFDATFNGTTRKKVAFENTSVDAAQVAPWGACLIRRLFVGNKWVELYDENGNMLAVEGRIKL